MAQAQAWAMVKPHVLVLMSFTLSHLSLVTCLATKEWVDLMTGNSPDMFAWGEIKTNSFLTVNFSLQKLNNNNNDLEISHHKHINIPIYHMIEIHKSYPTS